MNVIAGLLFLGKEINNFENHIFSFTARISIRILVSTNCHYSLTTLNTLLPCASKTVTK